MSSPFSKAYAFAVKGNPGTRTSSAHSELTTLSIGKDSNKIPVTKMADITSPVWEKQSCFSRFVTALRGQLTSHSVSDLISAISTHLPIETTAAYEEAMSVESKINKSATDIDYLEPVCFLDSKGHQLTMTGSDIEDRPADICYVQLTCTIDGSKIDPRIKQPQFSFDYCLKLPRSSRDPSTGEITLLHHTTASEPASPAPRKKSTSLFGGIVTTDDSSIVSSTPTKRFRLFSSTSTPSSAVISWYGNADFLDDKEIFRNEFGTDQPLLFPAKPVSGQSSNHITVCAGLHAYAQKCMFDVFLELCHIYYVGDTASADGSLAVQEVCQTISALRQEFRNRHGQMDVMSPDELFMLFLRYVPSLPEDPQTWTIQLGSTYFNALLDELKHKMLTSDFRVPQTQFPSTKDKELKALRTIRNVASEHFKRLKEEVNLVDRILGSRGGGQKRSNQQSVLGKTFFHAGENDDTTTIASTLTESVTNPPTQIFWQSESPAEQTIRRYTQPTTASTPTKQQQPNPLNLPCRVGPTGLLHPYRADDPGYLSKYPLGFRGCFKCGADDHNSWQQCPLKNDGNKKEFFRELWIHKPQTKRSNQNNQSSSSDRPVSMHTSRQSHQLFAKLFT